MSVIVIAGTPGLGAEGCQRIVTEHGHQAGKLPAACTARFAGPAGRGWRVAAIRDGAEQAAGSGGTVLALAMRRAGFTPSRPPVVPLHYALTRPEA